MYYVATAHDPDGTQRRAPNGDPLVYERLATHSNGARRALQSAKKAWWPVGPTAKHGLGPDWGKPPIGATIRLDGVPTLRFEEVEVVESDASGEIVDVRRSGEWVDIAERERDEARAARVAAYKARRAAEAAERIAAASVAAEDLVGGTVTVGDVTRPVAAGPAAVVPPTPPSRRRG